MGQASAAEYAAAGDDEARGIEHGEALAYALTTHGGEVVNSMSNDIFNGMTTEERAEYLKRQVIVGSAFIGRDKGTVAKELRDLKGLHNESVLTGLFYTSTPGNSNNGYVNASTYDFMNEPLRDFLNLNRNGTSQYIFADIAGQGFSQMFAFGFQLPPFSFIASLYHLDPNYSDVKKYTNADGQEVIFGLNKQTNKYEQINSELYRGTYNYMDSIMHFDFDMAPFDNKYGTNLFTALGSGVHYLVTDAAYNIGNIFH
ncbi:MAG: hypothetical protein LBF83_02390 [Spirochaetaceae bacterium]|jgi:hypothetical protein|nr:hypothetical protein [Spirochaetaceae bacterium]